MVFVNENVGIALDENKTGSFALGFILSVGPAQLYCNDASCLASFYLLLSWHNNLCRESWYNFLIRIGYTNMNLTFFENHRAQQEAFTVIKQLARLLVCDNSSTTRHVHRMLALNKRSPYLFRSYLFKYNRIFETWVWEVNESNDRPLILTTSIVNSRLAYTY